MACDGDRSGSFASKRLDDLKGSGFTRAVGAEQSENLTTENFKADPCDGYQAVIVLCQVLNRYNGFFQ